MKSKRMRIAAAGMVLGMPVFTRGQNDESNDGHPRASYPVAHPKSTPEELLDPDIAKRRAFVQHLSSARENLGFEFPGGNRGLKQNGIPDNAKQLVLERIQQVLSTRFVPKDVKGIEWWARIVDYPHYNRFGECEEIIAEWAVDNHGFRVYVSPSWPRIAVRLRIPDEKAISFRVPPNEVRVDYVQLQKHGYLDKTALHKVMTTFWEFPYGAPDDFRIHWTTFNYYDGVPVSTGEILSLFAEAESSAPSRPLEWFERARFLVTDSIPQYVCISVEVATRDSK